MKTHIQTWLKETICDQCNRKRICLTVYDGNRVYDDVCQECIDTAFAEAFAKSVMAKLGEK
jgi:hypothetical protein